MDNIIPIKPIRKSLDRFQFSLWTFKDAVFKKLKSTYKFKTDHVENKIVYNHYLNGKPKICYKKYKSDEAFFDVLIFHDVTYEDQLYLLDLLGEAYTCYHRIVEFAWDFFPQYKFDFWDMYNSISDGLRRNHVFWN